MALLSCNNFLLQMDGFVTTLALILRIFFLNFSSIHDHADSHCFLKVLDGRLKETQFPWPSESEPEKPIEPKGSRFYETNEVNYINGLF